MAIGNIITQAQANKSLVKIWLKEDEEPVIGIITAGYSGAASNSPGMMPFEESRIFYVTAFEPNAVAQYGKDVEQHAHGRRVEVFKGDILDIEHYNTPNT